jgi:hypothetical protein
MMESKLQNKEISDDDLETGSFEGDDVAAGDSNILNCVITSKTQGRSVFQVDYRSSV